MICSRRQEALALFIVLIHIVQEVTMDHSTCFKEFIKYASLNVLGMIGLSCYILADTFFISKGLGTRGLAALNLAIPVYSFIHGSGMMLGIGGATKYSINRNQHRHSQTMPDLIFTHTLCLGAVLALMFFLAGLFLSQAVTSLLGADREVFEMTNTYLKVILLFAPAFILNDIMVCFVRNAKDPRRSMLAMTGGSMANIVLDYIFIFPLDMGIFGAVLATGLAPLISLTILSGHWLGKKNGFHLTSPAPELPLVRYILSLGFPSLITEVSSGIVIIVFNTIILNLQGNVGVAAYGVVANLSLVVLSIFTGIAQGIQPLISRAYGYNKPEEIRLVFRYAFISVLAVSCLLYAGIFLGAGSITSIFNSEHNPQLQMIAETGLRLYFTAILFAGFNIIVAIYFTSTERALPAHAVSMLRGLILIIPTAFFLSALWGITGVWLAFPATELITALLGGVIYIKQHSDTL